MMFITLIIYQEDIRSIYLDTHEKYGNKIKILLKGPRNACEEIHFLPHKLNH